MKRRATCWSVATVLTVMACALTSCGSRGTSLEVPGEVQDVALYVRLTPGEQFLVGSISICRSGTGPLEIDSVETIGADLEVSGYSIRENPFESGGEMVGFSRGSLEDDDLDRTSAGEVTGQCGTDPAYELIVEMEAGVSDASATGYRIRYESDGSVGDLEIDYPLHACVDLVTQVCADNAPELPKDS